MSHARREKTRRGHWMRKLQEGMEQNIRLLLAKIRHRSERARGHEGRPARGGPLRHPQPSAGMEQRPLHPHRHGERATNLDVEDGALRSLPWAGSRRALDREPAAKLRSGTSRHQRDSARSATSTGSAASSRCGLDEAAERTLRTAIHIGLSPDAIADMVFAACTDHLFLDVGHSLDVANKAFELLDHIGWEHAEEVLPSLVPNMVQARRMEETSSWRQPVDLATLLGEGPRASWTTPSRRAADA